MEFLPVTVLASTYLRGRVLVKLLGTDGELPARDAEEPGFLGNRDENLLLDNYVWAALVEGLSR
ncbi:hypothetical protein LCGC14_0574110 [marine sediment metagenome]|uniref:Uncharacterized protein n=1 Tax=marine sediment metagenome TaxID=412755 RepID=A0A0F9U4T1_9ZZZZ